eukprot:TRINITY_DN1531_c0_g1_i18.p1 TRINITY_DN1531_c0_g1~~TRINITY_DN1531_c0_g1_i18.p1  ORF type:complete len:203 (+),score=-15.85 TRINITY_DN1531_c0_g1_i18:858-1466(+)
MYYKSLTLSSTRILTLPIARNSQTVKYEIQWIKLIVRSYNGYYYDLNYTFFLSDATNYTILFFKYAQQITLYVKKVYATSVYATNHILLFFAPYFFLSIRNKSPLSRKLQIIVPQVIVLKQNKVFRNYQLYKKYQQIHLFCPEHQMNQLCDTYYYNFKYTQEITTLKIIMNYNTNKYHQTQLGIPFTTILSKRNKLPLQRTF